MHNSYKPNQSQGYNTAGRSQSDCPEHSASVALNNDMIASQAQYQYLGSTNNLETPEAGFDSAPPQQAPSPFIPLTKTGPGVSTQNFDDLRTLVPDQVCTCAACLDGYRCPAHLWGWDVHPDCSSWIFGCRVAGCKWSTKDLTYVPRNPLEEFFYHEKRRSHYGKPGDWRCREADCKYVTKRWGDLMRHSSSKHCINPKSFECPVLSCKYHQQGFTRKDKLTSHIQKVHGGNSQPGKPNQAIKPKVGDRA